TQTLYPKRSHQLSVFITEPTKGVSITFRYPVEKLQVECIPIYSGQNRYPELIRKPGEIAVQTSLEQWIFPMSGIVFAY
ncbi:MAG TPA: alanine racemase, partial [Candidatus Cloacimonadota bacterium]|nr:alanine racemase [Candidatus Cloacimonadota bacterium]